MKYNNVVSESGFWIKPNDTISQTLERAISMFDDELSEQQLNVLQSLFLKDVSDYFSAQKQKTREAIYDDNGQLIHRAELKEGGFIKLGDNSQ